MIDNAILSDVRMNGSLKFLNNAFIEFSIFNPLGTTFSKRFQDESEVDIFLMDFLQEELTIPFNNVRTLAIFDERSGTTIYKHYFDGEITTFRNTWYATAETQLNVVLSKEMNGAWHVHNKSTNENYFMLADAGWIQTAYLKFTLEQEGIFLQGVKNKIEDDEKTIKYFSGIFALCQLGPLA